MAQQVGKTLRLFVCDDSFGYPVLIRNWVETFDEVEAVGMATTAAEMLRVLPKTSPDVVLLDLMLPDGLATPELVESVRQAAPGARVVLVSAMPDRILADEAQRVGADAYVSKMTSPGELLDVLTG